MSLWGLGCNSLWTQVGTLPLEPSSLPPGHNVFVNDTVRESGDVGEDNDDSEDSKEALNLLDNLAGFFFHGRTDRLLNQVALIKNKFDSVIIIIILDFILILIFVSTMIIFDLIVTISTLSLSPL